MAGFSSLSGSTSRSNQNFYGFKYDPVEDELTIEEILWGDISETIILPQRNDDGTIYAKYSDTYITEAVTPYELSFSWDTTDDSQLIMEVE